MKIMHPASLKNIFSLATTTLISSLFILSIPFAYADFDSAMGLYEAKNFSDSMAEFKRLSSLGHKQSQLNLGVMYFRGEGVEKNPVEAYAWAALAASDGDAERARTRDLIDKRLAKEEKSRALTRASELLAQMGDQALEEKLTPVMLSDMECQFQIKPLKMTQPKYPQEMMHEGKSGSVDVEYTIDKLGFARDYSAIVSTDKGFEKTIFTALRQWQYQPVLVDGKATEVAVTQLRVKFSIAGAKPDKNEVKKYLNDLRAKAELGKVADMYAFAYITNLLPELQVQRQESNSWYLKAAQAGLPRAQYEIGKSLMRGEGCKMDPEKGIYWLTMAAKSNSPNAQYFLGVSLLGSNKFVQNKQQAIEWLNHAVAGDHDKAAMRLAWILATDTDEHIRDPKRALALVTKVYEKYPDQLRANENLAAAQAANNLFDDAVKSQKSAISWAKRFDYPLTDLQARLVAYQQHQEWRE